MFASEGYPEVCRNLLTNCKHRHSPSQGREWYILLSPHLSEEVHSVFTIAAFAFPVEDGGSYNGDLCPSGPVLSAGSCTP